jgi:hypothetical protein
MVNGVTDGVVNSDLSIGQVVLHAGDKGASYNFGFITPIS